MTENTLFPCDGLEEKARHSLAVIRASALIDRPSMVSFSGGKDSCVLAHLCQQAGIDFRLYYAATGIDHPELQHFIRKNRPECIWVRPRMSFYRFVEKKGFPTRWCRWCCDVLKKDPLDKICNVGFTGVRKDESYNRAKIGRGAVECFRKTVKINPLYWWNAADVWEYIDLYKIPYSDLYNKYSRLGCVICPMQTEKSMLVAKAAYPHIFAAMDRAIMKYVETHNAIDQMTGEKYTLEGIYRIMYKREPGGKKQKNQTLLDLK